MSAACGSSSQAHLRGCLPPRGVSSCGDGCVGKTCVWGVRQGSCCTRAHGWQPPGGCLHACARGQHGEGATGSGVQRASAAGFGCLWDCRDPTGIYALSCGCVQSSPGEEMPGEGCVRPCRGGFPSASLIWGKKGRKREQWGWVGGPTRCPCSNQPAPANKSHLFQAWQQEAIPRANRAPGNWEKGKQGPAPAPSAPSQPQPWVSSPWG